MFRKTFPIAMLLAATMLPGAASAEPTTAGLKRQLVITRAAATIVVPAEWGGIWTVTDSTYDCSGVLQSVASSTDTLCPGEPAFDPQQSPVQIDCTGSADATTIDVICTGTSEVFPDCEASFTSSLQGTRSGETYFVVSTTRIEYSGTAPECDFLPDFCMQVNSHATRTAPAPVAYCQTPARPTSWGTLKVRYR